MKAPFKATAVGLALVAVGFAFLATEGGVFAAEGTSSVDVATASNKVSAAAGSIALAAHSAGGAPAAELLPAAESKTAPALAAAVETPRIDPAPVLPPEVAAPDGAVVPKIAPDVAETAPAGSDPETVAAVEPDQEVAPLGSPSTAIVPTPGLKPDLSRPTARPAASRSIGPGRTVLSPATERKRNVARRAGMRTVRVADEDLDDGRPRRFLSIPLPIVLGAYR